MSEYKWHEGRQFRYEAGEWFVEDERGGDVLRRRVEDVYGAAAEGLVRMLDRSQYLEGEASVSSGMEALEKQIVANMLLYAAQCVEEAVVAEEEQLPPGHSLEVAVSSTQGGWDTWTITSRGSNGLVSVVGSGRGRMTVAEAAQWLREHCPWARKEEEKSNVAVGDAPVPRRGSDEGRWLTAPMCTMRFYRGLLLLVDRDGGAYWIGDAVTGDPLHQGWLRPANNDAALTECVAAADGIADSDWWQRREEASGAEWHEAQGGDGQ